MRGRRLVWFVSTQLLRAGAGCADSDQRCGVVCAATVHFFPPAGLDKRFLILQFLPHRFSINCVVAAVIPSRFLAVPQRTYHLLPWIPLLPFSSSSRLMARTGAYAHRRFCDTHLLPLGSALGTGRFLTLLPTLVPPTTLHCWFHHRGLCLFVVPVRQYPAATCHLRSRATFMARSLHLHLYYHLPSMPPSCT